MMDVRVKRIYEQPARSDAAFLSELRVSARLELAPSGS